MEYFAGLDISMDETHICVIDREGAVVYESKTISMAEAIAVHVSCVLGILALDRSPIRRFRGNFRVAGLGGAFDVRRRQAEHPFRLLAHIGINRPRLQRHILPQPLL